MSLLKQLLTHHHELSQVETIRASNDFCLLGQSSGSLACTKPARDQDLLWHWGKTTQKSMSAA